MINEVLRPTRFVQPPKNESISLKVMNQKELEEYMIRLAKTNGFGLVGLEKQTQEALVEVAKERNNLVKRIENTEQQLIDLRKENEQVIGQMKALSFVLQKAEDERRWQKQQEEDEEVKEE